MNSIKLKTLSKLSAIILIVISLMACPSPNSNDNTGSNSTYELSIYNSSGHQYSFNNTPNKALTFEKLNVTSGAYKFIVYDSSDNILSDNIVSITKLHVIFINPDGTIQNN